MDHMIVSKSKTQQQQKRNSLTTANTVALNNSYFGDVDGFRFLWLFVTDFFLQAMTTARNVTYRTWRNTEFCGGLLGPNCFKLR